MEYIGISGKRFLVINFLRLIHSEIIIKDFNLSHHEENEDQFHKQEGQMKLFSQEMTNKIEAQFHCRRLQEGRRLWVRRWNFRRTARSDSRDSKFWSCNSTNSLVLNHSLFGRYDSQIKWQPVPIFHRMLCCGSKKWRWLFHWRNLGHRDQFLKRIFQISRCWTRWSLPLWTRSSRIPNIRRSISRIRKSKKRTGFHEEDRSLSWEDPLKANNPPVCSHSARK